MLTLASFLACKDDVVPEIPPEPILNFANENFGDISVERISALETPYEHYFSELANGRTLSDHVSISDISEQLEDIFPGASVLNFQEKENRGLPTWRLQLKMPGGGILKATLIQELAEVLTLEGLNGPFDYVVDPGGSFITLADAFQSAFNAQHGTIKRWALELEEEDKWEYEIHINDDEGGAWEIEIDAFSGELIAKKIKGEDDIEPEEDDQDAPDEIIEIVTSLVDGDVVHSEEGDETPGTWEVFVETGNGIVEILLDQETDELLKASGKGPDFDYEFDPGNGLLLFSVAKQIALDFQPGELDKWELFNEINEGGVVDIWIYQFKIIDQEGKVKIIKLDAVTGELLFDLPDDPLPDGLEDFISQMIEGEIVSWELKDEDGTLRWESTVQTTNGALIELKIDQEIANLIVAEGKTEPFDYNFTPPGDLVDLNVAMQAVLDSINGTITKWDLSEQIDPEDPLNQIWVYEIKLTDADGLNHNFTLDAESGEILEVGGGGPPQQSIPQELIDLVSEFVTGEITSWFESQRKGLSSYEINISTSGGDLVIYINTSTNELIEARDQTSPFDYEFTPGNNLLIFSAAKSIVASQTSGNIANWNLTLDDSDPDNLVWIYEFTVAGSGKVKIDASTGEIL